MKFCPYCGKEINESARFCPCCGKAMPVAPQNQPPSATIPTPPSKSVNNANSANHPNQKKGIYKKIAIAAIAVIVVILIVVFAVMPTLSGSSGQLSSMTTETSSTNSTSVSSNSTASNSSNNSNNSNTTSVSEADPNEGSPTKDITFENMTLSEDSTGRYVIKGTIKNKSAKEYTVDFSLSATKVTQDKYGEDKETSESSVSCYSVTPYVTAEPSSTITAWALKSGESRSFELYPANWSDAQVVYKNVEAKVKKMTLPDSVLAGKSMLVDTDGSKFEISNLAYSADGKLTGKLTNKSGQYLNSVDVYFKLTALNELVAASSSSGTRPVGAKLVEATVSNIKPGDTVDFSVNAGEGYKKADLLEVMYKPDTTKSAQN